MPGLNDIKAAFYDAQRNAANAFEVLYRDLDTVFKQADADAKTKAEADVKPKVEALP